MLDPMTSLAFSVYSGKGVHALLLGSGVSRSSGILTGWDIVLDLIRRVAKVEDKDCGEDPADWYEKTYEKKPDYSELLKVLARTSDERMQLLRAYFEPTGEELETATKTPTRAHHAIAKLVAEGYIRVIVTTNFDRLMERALEAAGVVPSVIASTDAILGSTPLSHSKCTVIKIHGDYLDTRLKNTPEEVGEYDPATNRLLDQVFDEYGLIVCGWSGEWDHALRAAIERCPNRRYTMYWSAFREVADVAQGLCQKRDAQIIRGMGADDFFTKLLEKVTALKDLDSSHPLTPRIAVAALKRYLAEDKDRIRLHDLVMEETGKVTTAVFGNPQGQTFTLKQYEAQLETLLPLLAAGGYWGKPAHRKLWLRCFQQLVTPKSGADSAVSIPMQFYPARISLYAFGIGAIAGGRLGNLASILARASVLDGFENLKPLVTALFHHDTSTLIQVAVEAGERSYKQLALPVSRYLHSYLRNILRDYLPEDSRYNDCFCRFEYLVALVLSDTYKKKLRISEYQAILGLYLDSTSPFQHYQAEIDSQKERWPLLRAGLFDGSLDRLKEVKIGFEQAANARASSMFLR